LQPADATEGASAGSGAAAGAARPDVAKIVYLSGMGLLIVCLAYALYSSLRRQQTAAAVPLPVTAASAPGNEPRADRAPAGSAAAGIPLTQDILPLKRSLADIEKRYGKKLELIRLTLVGPGQLEGNTVKTYKTGTATDELITRNGILYKRTLAFNISEIDGDIGAFCSAVFVYALYQTAFDLAYSSAAVPEKVKIDGDWFGAKCAELLKSGGQAAAHYEVHGGYAFGCINPGDGRLNFETVSEGLHRAEKAAVAAK